MPDTWSYTPTGLIGAKILLNAYSSYFSSHAPTEWKKDGYMEAKCDLNMIQELDPEIYHEFYGKFLTEVTPNHPDFVKSSLRFLVDPNPSNYRHPAPQEECTCGIYSYLDIEKATIISSATNTIIVLLECFGKILISDQKIIKSEKAQVVGIFNKIQMEKHFFQNINIMKITQTQRKTAEFFDVPIFSVDETKQLIEQQKKAHDIKLHEQIEFID